MRSHLAHGVLDFVGHVRNHLDGLAEVIPTALFEDDLFVDAARSQVVLARQVRMRKPLIMAEIEIGFRAVVGDKDFAMLKGRHGARIDVQVRVELHQVDLKPPAFEQAADGGWGQPLA